LLFEKLTIRYRFRSVCYLLDLGLTCGVSARTRHCARAPSLIIHENDGDGRSARHHVRPLHPFGHARATDPSLSAAQPDLACAENSANAGHPGCEPAWKPDPAGFGCISLIKRQESSHGGGSQSAPIGTPLRRRICERSRYVEPVYSRGRPSMLKYKLALSRTLRQQVSHGAANRGDGAHSRYLIGRNTRNSKVARWGAIRPRPAPVNSAAPGNQSALR